MTLLKIHLILYLLGTEIFFQTEILWLLVLWVDGYTAANYTVILQADRW